MYNKFVKNLYIFISIFILASCGGGGGGGSSDNNSGNNGGGTTTPTPAPTVSLSLSTSSIGVNDSFTISWSSANATSCSASGDWSDSIGTSGTLSITETEEGTKNYTITCSGAGGTSSDSVSVMVSAFSITFGLTSLTVDEDKIFNGNLNISANEEVTFTYSIFTNVSNGQLEINSSGDITYTPSPNYNGSDQFQIIATAVEKNISKSTTVNITVNPVNDSPVISFDDTISFSKNSIIFESDNSYTATVQDIDNQITDLEFSLNLGDETISATFNPDNDYEFTQKGTLEFDLFDIETAGLYNAVLIVSDGIDSTNVSFESWFATNMQTVTIQQDDDPDDGFDGGDKTAKDYKIYYLSGGPSSLAGTQYLFVGDSLDGSYDIDLYRTALTASVNKLNESDASEFFNPDYFNILSVEPADPDGTSPFGIRTECYSWDEDVYCIGESDEYCDRDTCAIDTDIFYDFLPEYEYRTHLISTLTRVIGRGVNSGNKNIQPIRENDPTSTSHTLMHELGHAHGEMGDEYRQDDDDRDVSDYADLNVNTSTESTISLLKWKHHIEDELNVLGKDIKVCYNTSDGSIYDRDADEYVVGADCECLANIWDDAGNFIRKNPECAKVGLYEGNYYGRFDNFRPTFCSIMDSCNSGGYGPVNVEGFAIGSIQNQGFFDAFDDAGYSDDPDNDDFGFTSNDRWKMTVKANYDPSKITLKWYVDGEEQTSLENQTTVSFSRPSNNEVQIYTLKVIDLTGTISAPDDVLDNTDFYEGLFQSYFVWCDYDTDNEECDWSYEPDPSEYNQFDYGYMDGPLGFSWGINWARW